MRRHVPALSLLGTLVLLPACETAPPPRENAAALPVAGPRMDTGTEIVALENTTPDEILPVVDDLIRQSGNGEVRVMADPRLNALIVHGDPLLREHVRDLVRELDVPATR